jgi:tRNA-intron endonuclease, archaea type
VRDRRALVPPLKCLISVNGRALLRLDRQEERLQEQEAIDAVLKSGLVFIERSERFEELEQGGYGDRDGKKLVLKDYEALYLLNAKKLRLTDEQGEQVGFEDLAESSQRRYRDAWTKFMIYRDLRARGYVVKEGFGFGTDFRVYERGDYPQKAARFVVFALDEGTKRNVEDLSESVRQIIKMGKEAIVAVIERRGEVIFYRVGRANFRR